MIASPASVAFNKVDCIPTLPINIRKTEDHIVFVQVKNA